MAKTTFTAEELEKAFDDLQKLNDNFPDLPIKLSFADSYRFWREETFPLTLKKLGADTDVTIGIKEFFDGEEGGDHNMRCVMEVGWGESQRYFLKTGVYSSWDDSEWDGPILEVTPETVEVIKWVTRGNENREG